jgi:hypothetical protein
VGEALDAARSKGIEVLHDCAIPRSRANIDHLVIGPTGVWIVDAKCYVNKTVERRDVGGWRRTDHRLYVDRRDRTSMIEGVARQVATVRTVLEAGDWAGVPVRGALCFVEADLGWFAKPFSIDGVLVTWRRELLAPIVGGRAVPRIVVPHDIEPLARHLAATFRPKA